MSTKIVAWITGTLTLLMALFSFVLSFNALTDLAAEHNVSIPYLFPLVVEAGVIIFSLNALYRSLQGEHAKWQWVLIIGSSLMAGTFNVLHSEPDVVSRVMAAMPSLFLLLSFESFLNQIKHGVKRASLVKRLDDLAAEFEQKQTQLQNEFEQERSRFEGDLEQLESVLNSKRSTVEQLTHDLADLEGRKADLEQQLVDLEAEKEAALAVQYDVLNQVNRDRLNSKEAAMDALLDFYRSNPNATLAEAGRAINRSKGTVSNYLSELEQAGLIHRNGSGVEVVNI